MESIRWSEGCLYLLDQRVLPHTTAWLEIRTWEAAAEAISSMAVRGAPAIAIAAAYGMALAIRKGADRNVAHSGLLASRPTAVNLEWALRRIQRVPDDEVEQEAQAIHREDRSVCQRLGDNGAHLLNGGILTICNTGSLATGGQGTALGMIRSAIAAGQPVHVYALETRPYLQGARLTAFECTTDNIPVTLLSDGMAGALMSTGSIDAVVVGCDRVAINGDTANKIGTYGLAVLAAHHGIPFYVAMPMSTLDQSCPNGGRISVEQRPASELRQLAGTAIAPNGVNVWNPGFDITPAQLITAWVTEEGPWTPTRL